MAIARIIASQLIHRSRQNSIISPIFAIQQSFSSISHHQPISTTCNCRYPSVSVFSSYNSPHHCNSIAITPQIRKLSNNKNMSIKPQVHGIFHKGTSTLTYIITDSTSKETIILDSVLDYDAGSGCTSNTHGEEVVKYCNDNGLIVKYILESHVHADHLTGAKFLKEKYMHNPIPSYNYCKYSLEYGYYFDALHKGQDFHLPSRLYNTWFRDSKLSHLRAVPQFLHIPFRGM